MARRKSFLERLRVGSTRVLMGLGDGPLTFGGRRAPPALIKKGKRKTKPSELDQRLILLDQIGELPKLLADCLPPLATQHIFTVVEASRLAAKLNVTIYHLIAAGVVIDGLSGEDLAEYVGAELKSLPRETEVTQPQRVRSPAEIKDPPVHEARVPVRDTADTADADLDDILQLLRRS
ncbi:hypothetical protein [Bosea sp. (in: a-proteobacteria)]|uniref:hypothetical protein n=1 Tax=Bosea sp. (in: a-proteobacteria) TaxID=1871050 RepID=UPI002B46FAC0|nr:hypothetical protein [Bosea sp. (in: a-proteobacteria)]WRH60033.1 MAG: hypothetical protein RSE11_09780 [Bosea sp. (in: a-proteobacteria)]